MIRDAAKHLKDQEGSTLAHQYLNFVYDMANRYSFPIQEADLDQALQITQEFISQHKNADSQLTVHAVGHCHIDTAWLWPYFETKRKIARSWSSQLEFMDLYGEHGYKFCASSAAHYWWLK